MLLKMLKVTFTEFVFSLLFSSKTESWSNQLKSVFLLKNIHISLNFKIKFKHTFCSVLFIIIKWHHLSKYHNFILFKLYIYSLEVLCNRLISWLSWTSVKMRKQITNWHSFCYKWYTIRFFSMKMMLFSTEKGILVLSMGSSNFWRIIPRISIFRCEFIQQHRFITTYLDTWINGVKQDTKALKCKNMIAML